jgi:hypothetical protein
MLPAKRMPLFDAYIMADWSGADRRRAGKQDCIERLMDFLIALGQDVEITVRPTRRNHGQVSVVFA